MTTPVKTPEPQRLKRPDESLFKRLTRQQLFIPIAALVLLVLRDRLEEKGMVTRSVSGRDARRRLIALTEKGREQLEVFRRQFGEVESLMVRGLSQEEVGALRSLLARVIQNLEEDRIYDENAVASRQAIQ